MAGIPGLDVTEIYEPQRRSLAVRPPYKPNFTLPSPERGIRVLNSQIPQPAVPAPGSIPVGQATEVFPPQVQVDPKVAAASKARTAEGLEGMNKRNLPQAIAQETRAARAGRIAGNLGRSALGAVPSALGVAAVEGADRAFAPAAPSTSSTPTVTGTAADQIPTGRGPRDSFEPIPAARPSFFRDTETGRNIGNALNAIPGGAAFANTLRGGSNVARASAAGVEMLRSGQTANAMRGPVDVPLAFPTNFAPKPATDVPETLTDVQRGGAADSVSNIPDNALRTGGYDQPEPFDTTAGNLRAAQISEDTMNQGIRNTPGGGFTQPIEAVNSIDKRNMQFDRDQQLHTLRQAMNHATSRGEKVAATAAYARLAEQPAPWEAAREGERQQTGQTARAGIREAGENSRAAILNNTAARRDEVLMRGQDLELAGRKGSLLADAAKNAQDQANKDRQFKLDEKKVGFEQAKTMQAERSARESQVQKNIEAVNVDPATGKPDAVAVAEYRRGLDRALARVNAKGMHELEPADEQKLFAASDMLKTMKANAGALPWKPDTLKTIDPYDLTNLRVLPNGDRQITRSGKAAGQIIPARFFNTEEGTRFFGGTQTNKYDILSGGK